MPNDRKFFLSQTGEVFKNTIQELNNLNVKNATGAFEAISQYANNLFSKPWRKEFKILKVKFIIHIHIYYIYVYIYIHIYISIINYFEM